MTYLLFLKQELSVFLGLKTPVNESSVFDDIMVRWTDKLSKFNDLEKALKEKKEESRVAFKVLQVGIQGTSKFS